jgi:enoyl-CoA hydratase/carnithine racemase
LRAELRQAVDHIAADDRMRALILTGAGKAFCSGGDIRGMQERLEQSAKAGEMGWRQQRALYETLQKSTISTAACLAYRRRNQRLAEAQVVY